MPVGLGRRLDTKTESPNFDSVGWWIRRIQIKRLGCLSSPTSSHIRGTAKGSFADTRLLTRSPDRNRGEAANPTTLLTRFAEELCRAQTRVGKEDWGLGIGYWLLGIGGRIAHAKVANPTTLQTRFAEELRRAPAAGGAGRGY